MKRLIPATILLSLLLTLCFVGNRFVLSTCRKTRQNIEKCYSAYTDKDYASAAEAASGIDERWYRTQKRLAVFVNHSMLDDVSKSTARLASYTEETIDAHFAAECIDILSVLHRMCDEQQILIENFY